MNCIARSETHCLIIAYLTQWSLTHFVGGGDADGATVFCFCMTVQCHLPSAEHHCAVMHMLLSFGPLEQDKARHISLAVRHLSVPCEGASSCRRPPQALFPPNKSIPNSMVSQRHWGHGPAQLFRQDSDLLHGPTIWFGMLGKALLSTREDNLDTVCAFFASLVIARVW